MKNKLNSIDPEKIINDIITNERKKIENSKKEIKDDYLENLKITTINNFLENIKTKSLKEVELELNSKLKEYNTQTKLYCDKKNKENKEFLNQLNGTKVKNNELETTITQLNQENKLLKEQLKQSENIIYKLQSKFEIFEKMKPTLEEFFKEFPDDDPVKVIQDIKQRKEASFKILEDLNELRTKLVLVEKEKNEENLKNQKTINDLSTKIHEIEIENRDKSEYYLKEIDQLKNELQNHLIYKKENIKLHNMLFHLYNQLIERLELCKDIKIDPALKVVERDFKPELFQNEEIMRYISTMLVTSNDFKSSKMLREVIAYANMMLRIFMKDKINQRFNPVEIFKLIKELLEKLISEKRQLKETIKSMKDRIIKLESQIKKENLEIKYKNLQYENLEKKFNEQFNSKISRSRENKRKFIMEQRRNHSAYSKLVDDFGMKVKDGQTLEEADMNEEDELNDLIRANSGNSVNKEQRGSAGSVGKDIFITENEQIVGYSKKLNQQRAGSAFKRPQSYTSRKLQSASTRPGTAYPLMRVMSATRNPNNLDEKHKKENNFIIKDFKTKSTKNFGKELYHSLKSSNNSNKAVTTKYKNLEISKNEDKLIRAASFKVLPSHIEELTSLVNNTNRIFLYKSKQNNSINNKENPNIFDKFEKVFQNKYNYLQKIQTTNLAQEDDIAKDKVLSDINNLIKNIEKKE